MHPTCLGVDGWMDVRYVSGRSCGAPVNSDPFDPYFSPWQPSTRTLLKYLMSYLTERNAP